MIDASYFYFSQFAKRKLSEKRNENDKRNLEQRQRDIKIGPIQD